MTRCYRSNAVLAVCLLGAAMLLHGSLLKANASRILKEGSPAPDFSLPDKSGQNISLSQLEKQPVLLLFWATKTDVMTHHSRRMLDTCDRLIHRFDSHSLQILAIRQPPFDKTGISEKYIENTAIKLLRDENADVYKKYGIFLIPTVVLLDRSHVIRKISGYTSKLPEKLENDLLSMLEPDALKARSSDAEQLTPQMRRARRHMNLAHKYAAKGLAEMAIKELNIALSAEPNLKEGLFLKAKLLLKLKRMDEAEKTLKHGLQISPENREGLLLKGRLLYMKEQLDEAEKILSRMTGHDVIKAESLKLQGDIASQRKTPEQAAEYYRRALNILLGQND